MLPEALCLNPFFLAFFVPQICKFTIYYQLPVPIIVYDASIPVPFCFVSHVTVFELSEVLHKHCTLTIHTCVNLVSILCRWKPSRVLPVTFCAPVHTAMSW